MTETSRPCPQCGTPCPWDIKFCGQCGTGLPARPAPRSQTLFGMPRVAADPTLAGVPGARTPPAPIPAPPSPPSPRGGGPTLHGVPDALGESWPPPRGPDRSPSVPPQPVSTPPPAAGPEISVWSESASSADWGGGGARADRGQSFAHSEPPAAAEGREAPPSEPPVPLEVPKRISDRPRYDAVFDPDARRPTRGPEDADPTPALPVRKGPLYAGIALVLFGLVSGLVALGHTGLTWLRSQTSSADVASAPSAPTSPAASLSSLSIESPGFEVFTEADSVMVSGAALDDATVRIDGVPVPVTGGRFAHRFALPEVGDYVISVVATEPGRSPIERVLKVQRVEDLEAEASRYPVERDLTYDAVAAAPADHRGRRVELRGRVYDVHVEEGRSRLQMVVAGCAPGQSCPVWITHPAPVEVHVGDWIRVLGEVAGAQQFRPRGHEDDVLTVPRIEARYVLPAGS